MPEERVWKCLISIKYLDEGEVVYADAECDALKITEGWKILMEPTEFPALAHLFSGNPYEMKVPANFLVASEDARFDYVGRESLDMTLPPED